MINSHKIFFNTNYSVELSNRTSSLEARKIHILRLEESWRLKRIATWIKLGDGNTKLFDNYATHLRNINSIWAIKVEDVKFVSNQSYLK